MEEKIKDLLTRYVDACNICTTCNCDECTLNMVIEDLKEIIHNKI